MSNMNNMSVNSNFIDLLQLDLDKFKRKFRKKGAVPHSSILEIIYLVSLLLNVFVVATTSIVMLL